MKNYYKNIIHVSTLPVWVMGEKAGMPSTYRMLDYFRSKTDNQIYISFTNNPTEINARESKLCFINLHIPEILTYKSSIIRSRLRNKILIIYILIKYGPYLKNLVRNIDSSILIGHLQMSAIVLKMLFPLNRIIFVKFYGTVRNYDYLKTKQYSRIIFEFILTFILSFCGYLLTNDGTNSDKLAYAMGISKNKISFLINGVEKRQQLDQEQAERAKSKLNIEKDRVVGLFVGRIRRSKGINHLIEFIAKTSHLPVHWIIVGEGDMLEEVKNHQFTNVSIIGSVPNEDLNVYYSLADLFLSFNILSNLNNPVYDALNFGLPVFSLDRGADPIGIKNIIITEQNNAELIDDFKEKFYLFINPDKKEINCWREEIRQWANNHLCSWDERYRKEWQFIKHRVRVCGRK